MVMRGIDVSNWQSGLNLQIAKNAGCEFVIIKATQGTAYTNPSRSRHLVQAANLDMLIGVYHFANGYNPESEATHFYNTVKSLIGKALLVLDFEKDIDTKIYGSNRQWVERFITKFKQLSGHYCLIYCDTRYLSQFKSSWISTSCPLWLARYPKKYTTWTRDTAPKCEPWKTLTIWQFTSQLKIPGYSDNLDGDLCYITRAEWLKMASGKTQPATPNKRKPTAQIVSNIIANKYGAGKIRREKLTALGYNPDDCQKLVNEYYQIAHKVIKGKYGNGNARKTALEKLGYNYAVVQQIVNILVKE